MAEFKQTVKDRDLQDELDGGEGGEGKRKSKDSNNNDENIFGKDKDVTQLDPFFVSADVEIVAKEKDVERREVMRDGRVPKFQHNVEKQQVKRDEAQARREGWEQKKEEERVEVERVKRTHRPMKINSAAYGTGLTQQKAVGAAPAAKSKLNIQF